MLLRALEEKDIETVNELIARRPSLVAEGLGSSRRTPLHVAAGGGESSIVDFLIKSGAPLEARDNDGATPLHHAAAYGRSEAAEILLDAGANPSAINAAGRTPLVPATKNHFALRDRSVANLLLKRGDELDLFSALAMAKFAEARRMIVENPDCVSGSIYAAEILSVVISSIPSIAGGRFTPGSSDHPINSDVLAILRLLVDAGAPIDRIDRAISGALALENPSIAEFLLETAARQTNWTPAEKEKLGVRFNFTAKNSGAREAMFNLLERFGYK